MVTMCQIQAKLPPEWYRFSVWPMDCYSCLGSLTFQIVKFTALRLTLRVNSFKIITDSIQSGVSEYWQLLKLVIPRILVAFDVIMDFSIYIVFKKTWCRTLCNNFIKATGHSGSKTFRQHCRGVPKTHRQCCRSVRTLQQYSSAAEVSVHLHQLLTDSENYFTVDTAMNYKQILCNISRRLLKTLLHYRGKHES